MLNTLFTVAAYIVGIAFLIGVAVSIPVFLLGLTMAMLSKITGKKAQPVLSEYSEEDVKAIMDINTEVEKAIKEYGIKDETMKTTILNEIIKQKGYKYENGKLVKA